MCAAQLHFGVLYISIPQQKRDAAKVPQHPFCFIFHLADLSTCRNVLFRLHKDYVALRVLCAEDHAL